VKKWPASWIRIRKARPAIETRTLIPGIPALCGLVVA
jgi:hypothetical protein